MIIFIKKLYFLRIKIFDILMNKILKKIDLKQKNVLYHV